MKKFSEWSKQKEEFELWEELKIDESILDVLKGVAGTGSGVLKTGAGIMTMGDEALAKIVGQGTKGRMKSGYDQFKKGIRQALIGMPKEKDTHHVEIPQEQKPLKTPDMVSPEHSPEQKPKIQTIQKQATAKQKEPTKQSEMPSDVWEELVNKYKSATTREQRREIQMQMAKADPVRYQKAVERAKQLKLRSKAIQSGMGSPLRVKS